MKPGLLMCSGGIDSITMAYWLRQQGALRSLFFCDYGQASGDHQAEIVHEHALRLRVGARREMFDWPEYAKGKGYIFKDHHYPKGVVDPYGPTRMTKAEYDTYLEEQWDFIQGRNLAFLTRACAYAIHLGLDTVYMAHQFDQPEWEAGIGMSDTSEEFVSAFNALAAIGSFSKPVRVEAPFLTLRRTKQEIVRLGRVLGVPLSRTYSCEFFPECGECRQCLIRKDVLAMPVRFR